MQRQMQTQRQRQRAAGKYLVVNRHDRVARAELHARANHAVDLLRHFGVAALHSVEIEVAAIVALQHRRGRAAAHAWRAGRGLLCAGVRA